MVEIPTDAFMYFVQVPEEAVPALAVRAPDIAQPEGDCDVVSDEKMRAINATYSCFAPRRSSGYLSARLCK